MSYKRKGTIKMKDKMNEKVKENEKKDDWKLAMNMPVLFFTIFIVALNAFFVFADFRAFYWCQKYGLDVYSGEFAEYVLENGRMPMILNQMGLRGQSMFPTMIEGEQWSCDEAAIIERIRVNDIISFYGNNGEIWGKRVVAVGGDEIKIDENGLWRNGKLVDEPYVWPENWSEAVEVESIVIPKNHVYVLGDNRLNSTDSRVIGPVDLEKDFYCKYIQQEYGFKPLK